MMDFIQSRSRYLTVGALLLIVFSLLAPPAATVRADDEEIVFPNFEEADCECPELISKFDMTAHRTYYDKDGMEAWFKMEPEGHPATFLKQKTGWCRSPQECQDARDSWFDTTHDWVTWIEEVQRVKEGIEQGRGYKIIELDEDITDSYVSFVYLDSYHRCFGGRKFTYEDAFSVNINYDGFRDEQVLIDAMNELEECIRAVLKRKMQEMGARETEDRDEESHTAIRLVDEQTKVYSLKELDPTLKFQISGIDRNNITPEPHGLRFFADLTVSGKNDLNEWEIGPRKCLFKPLAVQTRYKWIDEQTLIFEVPLREILWDSMGVGEPYGFLTTNHFGSDPDSGIPGEMAVTLTLNPQEILVTKYAQAEQELEHDSDKTEAKYFFGSEIDLEEDSKLKTGDPHPSYWHDYPDVVLCILKIVPGVEGPIDFIDAGIQFYGGDYVDALITLITPAPVEIIFALPESKNIFEEVFPDTPESVVRDSEDALRERGYAPISGFQVTKDFPIWVNLTDRKFALIDPSGIVHKVNPPENFHIGYPYFTLWEASPSGRYVSYAIQDNDGAFTDWISGCPDTTSIPIVPPPRAFHPVRVVLSTEVNTVYGQGSAPVASELRIKMNSPLSQDKGQGELILRDASGIKQPGLMGILDLGWRHEKTEELILEDPYACLISGELYVNDVQNTMIGVGYYERVQGEMISMVPKVWCDPSGTEYVIKMTPEEEHDFNITVMQGSVDLLDMNGNLIDTVASGESKDIVFPDISSGSNAVAIIVPIVVIVAIATAAFVFFRRRRARANLHGGGD